ncbi:unnamed protein product, partial [Allacma fusca]
MNYIFVQIFCGVLLLCSYSLAAPQKVSIDWMPANPAANPIAAVEGAVKGGTQALNSSVNLALNGWWESLDNIQKEKAKNLTKLVWSLVHSDEPVPEPDDSEDENTKRIRKVTQIV